MVAIHNDELREAIGHVAPGTELRDGLERILRGRTGALVVLGYDDTVESISSGGFHLDVEFTATRLRELAKMDGAVVVDFAARRIRRANVQLTPGTHIETSESGMRHRTAERAAKQTGHPVITVSQSMRTVSLYVAEQRHVIVDTDILLARANQALATLERYRSRLDEVSGNLSAVEIEDLVTVREVATVVQRLEMVSRIAVEIEGHVLELGIDGRLIALQLEELMGGITKDRELIVADYARDGQGTDGNGTEEVLARLTSMRSAEMVDLSAIATRLGIGGADGQSLDDPISPRGYRMLSRVPRLRPSLVTAIVEEAGPLQRVLAASTEDLQEITGVGPNVARAVREGLTRLAESALVERYG